MGLTGGSPGAIALNTARSSTHSSSRASPVSTPSWMARAPRRSVSALFYGPNTGDDEQVRQPTHLPKDPTNVGRQPLSRSGKLVRSSHEHEITSGTTRSSNRRGYG